MNPLVALVLLVALVAPARADLGHWAYMDIVQREEARKQKRAAVQRCKPLGTPLLAIEGRVSGLVVSRIAIYPLGGWTATKLDGPSTSGCVVMARTMAQLRGNVLRMQWKTDPRTSCELLADLNPVETVYVASGRVRFVDRGCGPTLRTADDERLVETEAILAALIRNGRR